MQSAKCKTKSVGIVAETRRVVRTVAALCSENRQARQCSARKSTGPTCGWPVDSRGHRWAAKLRRSTGGGESRRFRSQVEHCSEGTPRVANLASVHHFGRTTEASCGSAAACRMRGTLPHHRQINCHGQNADVEREHAKPWGQFKMRSAKCKVQNEPTRRARAGFALCILHFALTASPFPR